VYFAVIDALVTLQVVWSSSYEVGCGLHRCSQVARTMLSDAYYLVCNYGPASVARLSVKVFRKYHGK